MYLLQINPDSYNNFLYLAGALVLSLIITYFIIKSAVNGARITAYQQAQLKLAALMARKDGVELEEIKMILNEADHYILLADGNHFDKVISNISAA